MVGAVERVDQEQQPEPDHRQEVAEDRPAGDGGDDGIGDREGQRRDEQPDGIVNPEPAECRPLGTRKVLGHDVADRVGQQGERQARQGCTRPRRTGSAPWPAPAGTTNWAIARPIPSVAAPSTGSGNSAHSSGWLTPA